MVGEKVFEIPAAAARLEIYLEICARSKLKRFETEMKKRFSFEKNSFKIRVPAFETSFAYS